MKKFFVSVFLSISLLSAFSAHIKGGFFTYEYLGQGSDATKVRYKITLTVYMSCNPSSGQVTNPINFSIFQGNSAAMIANVSVPLTTRYDLGKVVDEPCITNDQAVCYYTIVQYVLADYEFTVNSSGYTISYQRCCRIAGMENLQNSGNVGNTYSITIPG